MNLSMCADSSTDTKNKGRHGTDPWSHQILPLLKLDVPTGIRRPHDHGFALQAEDHGKKGILLRFLPTVSTAAI